jgi:hypothetical protein
MYIPPHWTWYVFITIARSPHLQSNVFKDLSKRKWQLGLACNAKFIQSLHWHCQLKYTGRDMSDTSKLPIHTSYSHLNSWKVTSKNNSHEYEEISIPTIKVTRTRQKSSEQWGRRNTSS